MASILHRDLVFFCQRKDLVKRFLLALCVFGIVLASSEAKYGTANSTFPLPLKRQVGEHSQLDPDESLQDCPYVPPSKHLSVFWQTGQGLSDCSRIPDGVTHVIWGWVEVGHGDSTAIAHFQDKEGVKRCVEQLHSRCIKSLAVVGGWDNQHNMATIDNPQQFADSVWQIIQEYNLDGVDVDDETTGSEYDKNRIINYMGALYMKLKGISPYYVITYDEFFFSALEDRCHGQGRCFAKEIVPMVDWVHIMAYNVNADSNQANAIYESAIYNAFPAWESAVGNAAKVSFGICVPEGCDYGPGPSIPVVRQWSDYSRQRGGMMLFAGSTDCRHNFEYTNEIIAHLR